MGSGVSVRMEHQQKKLSSENKKNSGAIRDYISQLERNLKDGQEMILIKTEQVQKLEDAAAEKDEKINKLNVENHKLRVILSQLENVLSDNKIVNKAHGFGTMEKISEEVSSSYWHDNLKVKRSRGKKVGVSGETTAIKLKDGKASLRMEFKYYSKDLSCRQLIRRVILENDFMKHLQMPQVQEIVKCMYPCTFSENEIIIREGEYGNRLYVTAEGNFEITKDGNLLTEVGAGVAFGELAILYNCRRTATITATTNCKAWAIDRDIFQMIMLKTGIAQHEEHMQFLESVPLLKHLPAGKLAKIAGVLDVNFYKQEEYIVRENETGDTFYIIRKGEVIVTRRMIEKDSDVFVRTLVRGDYFGERALLSEENRTANVIVQSSEVECLVLDREDFTQLIGNLDELKEKDYHDEVYRGTKQVTRNPSSTNDEYRTLELKDLDQIATLGMGGFGRVELVTLFRDKSRSFALKCMKKKHIVDTKQQEHVYSEKKLLAELNSPFIVKLYKTFKDKKFVYMLMEACLGGELWTILRDRGNFDEHSTRFFTACVVEAFEYLHVRGIVYRDLKPENLLLDAIGYIKLVDFGFAKKVGLGSKTWTFCGTPEYVSPEVILNRGHNFSADYWGLGILMFELLTGSPPFTSDDPMKTYNLILRGIDRVDFPRKIGKNAQNLIRKLCKENPAERIGYQKNGIKDIQKHKWFQGFDWNGLRKREIKSPMEPTIKGPLDHSNFDTFDQSNELPIDETSGWDENF